MPSIALILAKKLHGDKGGEEPEDPMMVGKKTASEELLSAIKDDDPKAMMDALESFIRLCHEEYDEDEEKEEGEEEGEKTY